LVAEVAQISQEADQLAGRALLVGGGRFGAGRVGAGKAITGLLG
jgi:hypothetical protein